MRLLRFGLTNEERKRSEAFAIWLLDVGNGEIGEPNEEDDQDSSWVAIPPENSVNADETGLSQLIDFIYDDATLNCRSFTRESNRRNKTYLSSDEAIPTGRETSEAELLYPMKYLNTITFPGFPPHELELKVGSLIMLLSKLPEKSGHRKPRVSDSLNKCQSYPQSSIVSALFKLQNLKLSATSATHYYINLRTPEAEYAYRAYPNIGMKILNKKKQGTNKLCLRCYNKTQQASREYALRVKP
ncbi:DNA helicase [Tanacetum coccineum]